MLVLLLRIALLALAYTVGARLGLRLAYSNRNVTAVWPPTGIAVAALLVWGRSVWPGIAIGAFVANFSNGTSVATAAAITVGNTLAPFVGAWLVRTVASTRDGLESLRDVFSLVVFGGLAAMTISATFGTAALAATHALGGSSVWSVWLVWWIGDAIGVILFAPVLIQLAYIDRNTTLLRRPVEGVLLLGATGALTWALFRVQIPISYVVLGLIVWVAIRLGRLGASIATVIVTVTAVAMTVNGHGPFLFGTPTEGLVALQTFNAAIGFASLALATVMLERRRIEAALRASEQRYRVLFEQADDFMCVHDRDGRIVYANDAAARMSAYPIERLLTMAITDLVAPMSVQTIRRSIDRQLATDTEAVTYEMDIATAYGKRVLLEASSTLLDENGDTVFQVVGRDITARKGAEDELRRLALRDDLTGLANRTLVEERTDFALAMAGRTNDTVAVALVNVDGFGTVNDGYSRRDGDEVLKQVGNRLHDAFRSPETAGRLFANTFLVVIPRIAPESSPSVLGERIREVFAGPFRAATDPISLSASTGIAISSSGSMNAQDVIARADTAMRSVKQGGGNGYALYRTDMDAGHIRTRALISDLEREGVDAFLALAFQPKVEIATMRTVGVECLVRIASRNVGIVEPDAFLDAAEEAGLDAHIARWVLDHAMYQCAAWIGAGLDLSVSVNVSSRSIASGSIIEIVRRALSDHGVPPEKLILEVKERDVVDRASTDVLRRLRDAGAQISVDDFGTGTSSVVQLRNAPIAEVKIDRSLVANLCSGAADLTVVRSLMDVARNLGLRTVAEGVEARDIWNVLGTLGCDQAQGFLLSPPLPADELESWLRAPAWSGRTH